MSNFPEGLDALAHSALAAMVHALVLRLFGLDLGLYRAKSCLQVSTTQAHLNEAAASTKSWRHAWTYSAVSRNHAHLKPDFHLIQAQCFEHRGGGSVGESQKGSARLPARDSHGFGRSRSLVAARCREPTGSDEL